MNRYYKYRSESTLERDIQGLEECYFYAPTADQLNDPTEGVINDQLVLGLVGLLGQPVEDSLSNLLKLRHSVGIFSLSKNIQDEVMWAHYGESHLGYCIEYDVRRLMLEPRTQWSLLPIKYSGYPPEFRLQDLLGPNGESIEQMLIGYKSERWNYEEEVRIVTARSGKNHYAQAAVTGIYFGCRCNKKLEEKVRNSLSGRGVKYYKMNYPNSTYKLQFHELPYDRVLDGEPTINLAPISEQAISTERELGEYAYLHPKLIKAVERVRKDPSCIQIEFASVSKIPPNEGMLFVQFQTAVKTDLYDRVNWYFNPEEIQ
ncbi:MAG: DUF2971 domain-containing protein [Pseudohongiella sp.]|nr:DUF2971 domain-containing protein [Pseudohongiella sp.]